MGETLDLIRMMREIQRYVCSLPGFSGPESESNRQSTLAENIARQTLSSRIARDRL